MKLQTTPDLNPPIAFNISHDNNLVAMAFGPGSDDPPAFRIGVDVMKVELPKRSPFPQFVKAFSEQVSEVLPSGFHAPIPLRTVNR